MTTLDLDALERAARDRVWIWFADNGNIRKWQSERFEEGTEYLSRAEHNRIIAKQAAAARTLQASTLGQVRHLEEKDRSEYVAAATLDSEREANHRLTEEIRALQERVEGAEGANERDRTSIMKHCNSVADAITRRRWLMTSRGSYEWDDERYRQEFAAAIEEIEAAIEPLRKIGSDLTNCPRTQAEVVAARTKAGEPHEQE